MTQIIVYHGKKGFINRFVRRICKDTETHVAFLHEDESVSGARPKGGFLRRPKHNYKNCLADIYSINLSPEQRQTLDMSIKAHYGDKYDWWGLLGYWFARIWNIQFDSKKKNFCSEACVDRIRDTGASFHGCKDSGLIAPCDFADDLHRIRLIRTVRIKNYKSN